MNRTGDQTDALINRASNACKIVVKRQANGQITNERADEQTASQTDRPINGQATDGRTGKHKQTNRGPDNEQIKEQTDKQIEDIYCQPLMQSTSPCQTQCRMRFNLTNFVNHDYFYTSLMDLQRISSSQNCTCVKPTMFFTKTKLGDKFNENSQSSMKILSY